MKKYINTDRVVPAAFFLLLLAIWQLVCSAGLVAPYILPSPISIVEAFFQNIGTMWGHILITLEEAGIGFFLSIGMAIVIAMLMDSIPLVRKAIYPLILVSQTIPTIALAPLFVMWFGFGLLPKVVVVVLVCFFPIVVSLLDGLAGVDPDMVNLMRSMGAGRVQILRHLKLPAAAPSFFSGLRIAATYSIMGAVIGEWLGGSAGIGVFMMRVRKSFALDKMFAAIVVIVVLSMLLFWLLSVVENAAMPWQRLIRKEKSK